MELYVIEWWSKSAVTFRRDYCFNPSEYVAALTGAGDATQIRYQRVDEIVTAYWEIVDNAE